MLPVMFWIQPSVPSSTAPTSACVTKSTNSSNEPIENWVLMPTMSSRTPAVAHAITLHAVDVKNGLPRSEEHTSELQSQSNLVCRLLLEKKKIKKHNRMKNK